MPEPWVYWNDRFVPQSQARLTLHDAGFVMGATITDLCRTVRHKIYRWPEHLQRFRLSCLAGEIYPPLGVDEITPIAEELVAHNAQFISTSEDLALVVFVTAGPIGYYLGEEGGLGSAPVTFGMHTFPLPLARYRPWVRDGVSLVVPNIRPVPKDCVDPRIKQRSRMHWWLADRQGQRMEAGALALLADEKGHLTETAGANFLLVEGKALVSPPRCNILAGISLGVVRELAGPLGLDFVEREITLYDACAADEAFLTSTPYCLAGVRSLQGRRLPFPGPTALRILEAWNRGIGLNIHRQILGE